MIEKLFEDHIGAGADIEEGRYGAWVRLSHWTSEVMDFPSYPNHYLIEMKVMVDGEIVEDFKDIFFQNFRRDSEFIRKAINKFDNNVANYEIKKLLKD